MSALEADLVRLGLHPEGECLITLGELVAKLSPDGARELWLDLVSARDGNLISPALTYLLTQGLGPKPEEPEPIALGEARLVMGTDESELRVFASAESWEAAGREGCVILDWDACLPYLQTWPRVVAETRALAEKIEARLLEHMHRLAPQSPVIMVEDGNAP